MPLDYAVRDGNKGLMQAFTAFYLRLTAYPLGPFIGAGRSVAGSACFPVFPSDRKNVSTAGEQSLKKRHLVSRRGRGGYGRWISRLYRRIIDADRRLAPAMKRRET